MESDPVNLALELSKLRTERELAEAGIGATPTATVSDQEAAEHSRRVEAAYKYERARREAHRRLAEEERSPIDPPLLRTVRERLASPQPPIQPRIEGWQQRGTRAVLAAQNKSGKTVAVQNLMRSLVDGDLWLNRYAVSPVDGVVALLDFEMNAAQLDAWFRDQSIIHDDRVIAESMRGRADTFDITDPNIRARWAEWLRARSVSYLILDCLRPCLDATGLDENHDAGRFLVDFDALLAEAGIGEAMVVHHFGHSNERSRGDSRILDWPDASWTLVREADDPTSTRFIRAYGRDIDQPEQRLAYDPVTRRLSIDGGSRREQAAVEALDAVLVVLDGAEKPLSGRAIEKALDHTEHSRESVRLAIRRGTTEGAIATERGSRNAVLHRRQTQCAGVRGERAARTVDECASAYIDTRAHTVIATPQQSQNAGALDFDNKPKVDDSAFDPSEAFGRRQTRAVAIGWLARVQPETRSEEQREWANL